MRAGETIHADYHQCVAGPQVIEGCTQAGAVPGGATDGVGEHLLRAGFVQSAGLSVEVLLGAADAGVTDNLTGGV